MIILTRWTMHAGPMPASVTDDPGPEIERGTGEIVAPQTMMCGFVRFFDGDGKAQIQGEFRNPCAGQRITFDFGASAIPYPQPMTGDSLSVDSPWPEAFGNAQIDLGPMDIFEICAIGRLVGAESSRVTAGFSMPPPEKWDE